MGGGWLVARKIIGNTIGQYVDKFIVHVTVFIRNEQRNDRFLINQIGIMCLNPVAVFAFHHKHNVGPAEQARR